MAPDVVKALYEQLTVPARRRVDLVILEEIEFGHTNNVVDMGTWKDKSTLS